MLQAVREASVWTRTSMAAEQSWIRQLSGAEIAELAGAVRGLSGQPFHAVRARHFPLPGCAALLAQLRHELAEGRGVMLLRGWPAAEFSDEENRLLTWGLGAHLGTAVSQNAAAELVAGVYDRGIDYGSRNARAYQVNAELKLHNDNSDIVALMCVRQAESGGETLLVSATSVWNRLLETAPLLVPLLLNGFIYCRKGEQGEGEPPISQRIPVFGWDEGKLSCRYARSYIDHAQKTIGINLAPMELAALAALDAACNAPDLLLEFTMQPGDIEFANNYTVLHARRAFQDNPAAKRLMWRLWLEAEWLRPVADPMIRWGFSRYGNHGRTADQLFPGAALAG